jgi:hypothetical protein
MEIESDLHREELMTHPMKLKPEKKGMERFLE